MSTQRLILSVLLITVFLASGFGGPRTKGIDVRDAVKREVSRQRAAQLTKERGTVLTPGTSSRGDRLEFEAAVSDWFRSNDPVSPQRVAFFDDVLKHHDCVITGWYGAIQSVEPQDTGWVVRLRLSPYLASPRYVIPSTTAHCLEEWYIDSDGAVDLLQVTKGDGLALFLSD